MYKIGIIGDRDSVLGFMALGFTVYDVKDPEDARVKLRSAVKDGYFAVIFVTEKIAEAIEDEIEKYKDMPLPAIVSVPGRDGSTGYGMENIRQAALRAVGADILFGGHD
ncbi:MAG: V-type ATP synthase subunit F [Clostridia bacterium]|nr:V-type ATP synthase subunit F [Clostridia bacterium]